MNNEKIISRSSSNCNFYINGIFHETGQVSTQMSSECTSVQLRNMWYIHKQENTACKHTINLEISSCYGTTILVGSDRHVLSSILWENFDDVEHNFSCLTIVVSTEIWILLNKASIAEPRHFRHWVTSDLGFELDLLAIHDLEWSEVDDELGWGAFQLKDDLTPLGTEGSGAALGDEGRGGDLLLLGGDLHLHPHALQSRLLPHVQLGHLSSRLRKLKLYLILFRCRMVINGNGFWESSLLDQWQLQNEYIYAIHYTGRERLIRTRLIRSST